MGTPTNLMFINTEIETNEITSKTIETLNELSANYRLCFGGAGVQGYICITEENGFWCEETKYIQINVYA